MELHMYVTYTKFDFDLLTKKWVLVVTVVWGVVHLVVCVLQAPVVLLSLHAFLHKKRQTMACWGLLVSS
jgi:hypothetical protein